MVKLTLQSRLDAGESDGEESKTKSLRLPQPLHSAAKRARERLAALKESKGEQAIEEALEKARAEARALVLKQRALLKVNCKDEHSSSSSDEESSSDDNSHSVEREQSSKSDSDSSSVESARSGGDEEGDGGLLMPDVEVVATPRKPLGWDRRAQASILNKLQSAKPLRSADNKMRIEQDVAGLTDGTATNEQLAGRPRVMSASEFHSLAKATSATAVSTAMRDGASVMPVLQESGDGADDDDEQDGESRKRRSATGGGDNRKRSRSPLPAESAAADDGDGGNARASGAARVQIVWLQREGHLTRRWEFSSDEAAKEASKRARKRPDTASGRSSASSASLKRSRDARESSSRTSTTAITAATVDVELPPIAPAIGVTVAAVASLTIDESAATGGGGGGGARKRSAHRKRDNNDALLMAITEAANERERRKRRDKERPRSSSTTKHDRDRHERERRSRTAAADGTADKGGSAGARLRASGEGGRRRRHSNHEGNISSAVSVGGGGTATATGAGGDKKEKEKEVPSTSASAAATTTTAALADIEETSDGAGATAELVSVDELISWHQAKRFHDVKSMLARLGKEDQRAFKQRLSELRKERKGKSGGDANDDDDGESKQLWIEVIFPERDGRAHAKRVPLTASTTATDVITKVRAAYERWANDSSFSGKIDVSVHDSYSGKRVGLLSESTLRPLATHNGLVDEGIMPAFRIVID